jgi:Ni/Co efflux regulator RcnB
MENEMRRKLMMTMITIAGAMLLFTPLAAAQADQKTDKSKQGQQEAKKQKAEAKAKKTVRASSSSASSDSAVSIIDAKTTTDVEEREAVGTSSSFNKGDKVTVWLAVKNPEQAQKVNLVFFRNDAEAGTIELDVGKSYRWRTWGRRTVGSAGDWKVDVQDEDGTSLKTLEFTVN